LVGLALVILFWVKTGRASPFTRKDTDLISYGFGGASTLAYA
jgi:hypothetical protein